MFSTSLEMWDIIEDGLEDPRLSRVKEHSEASASLGDAEDGDRLFPRLFWWREALGSLIKIHSFPLAEHLEHGCSKSHLILDSAQAWHDFRLDLLAFLASPQVLLCLVSKSLRVNSALQLYKMQISISMLGVSRKDPYRASMGSFIGVWT